MTDALVISGSGPYADRWHSFPDTSARIARIIEDLGYTVTFSDDVEHTLAYPGPCRLLVVNIGNPSTPRPAEAIDAVRSGLQNHLAGGGSLLGIHVSVTSLTTMPQWPTILGGHWVPGHSMHPPQGETTISVNPTDHPVTAGLVDFAVNDERYSYLQTNPDISVLCEHTFDGIRHPVVWSRETESSRVIYDGLGHDTTSYNSAGHVTLLQRAVRWLLHDPFDDEQRGSRAP
jgi:type 1 glutamine amidotransferase